MDWSQPVTNAKNDELVLDWEDPEPAEAEEAEAPLEMKPLEESECIRHARQGLVKTATGYSFSHCAHNFEQKLSQTFFIIQLC